MEVILTIEHLRKHFSAEPVLVDVCFQLRAGDKVGLVYDTMVAVWSSENR